MIPQTYKDEVARRYGYKDWADLGSDFTSPSAPWYKITQYLEESALLYCKSKEQKWISVDERFPHCNIPVLVWHSSRKTILVATAYNRGYKTRADHWSYYDIDGTNHVYFKEKTITHWMPLPEPPKPEFKP